VQQADADFVFHAHAREEGYAVVALDHFAG
jgi:hypothetical protein